MAEWRVRLVESAGSCMVVGGLSGVYSTVLCLRLCREYDCGRAVCFIEVGISEVVKMSGSIVFYYSSCNTDQGVQLISEYLGGKTLLRI